MKTHSLAKALEQLAEILRAGPNVELSELDDEVRWKKQKLHPDEIEIGVVQLAALSQVDKQDWVDLIERHDFPIEVKPRDGSRNIVGKLMSHLDKNPNDLTQLSGDSSKSEKSSSSPELSKALDILLKDS